MSQLDKQDPRDQYARPPFPAQTQQGSGLASAMDPAPDHGETSYLGTGRMPGYRVLVTGADSGIGRAAAIAMAKEGADVALNALPEEQEDLEQVRDVVGDLGRRAVLLPGAMCGTAARTSQNNEYRLTFIVRSKSSVDCWVTSSCTCW